MSTGNDDTQGELSQNQTIDDIFDSTPKVEDEVETDEKDDKSEQSAVENSEDDSSKDEESEENDEENDEESDESAPSEEDKPVPKKALIEERRKRQLAEERAAELESKYQEKQQDEIPQDPEEYKKYIADQNNLNALRIKVALSRDLLIDSKPDYEEKEKVFVELAQKNPYLVQEMNSSHNPAKFAYQTAEKHLEVQKLSDPSYKENLKEQLRKEILEELQKEGKKPKKSALDLPDLTKSTAAGKNSDKTTPISTLDDVMKDSPF